MIRRSLNALATSANLLQSTLPKMPYGGTNVANVPKPFHEASCRERLTQASVQDKALKYRALALSGEYDAETSKMLMELSEMVEAKVDDTITSDLTLPH